MNVQSGVNVQSGIVDDLTDAPAGVLTAAGRAGHLYDTLDWFRVEVAAGTAPRLAWAVSEDGGVAYTTLVECRPSDPAWPYARPDLLLHEVGAVAAPAAGLMPAVLVGGRRPGHSSVVVDAAEGSRAPVTTALMDAVTSFAIRRGHASLLVPFMETGLAAQLAGATALPCLRVRSGTSWSLHLPGDDIDDWLASLERRARFNEKATLRKVAGYRFEWRTLDEADLDWIVPLELAQYDKYGHDYGADAARALHRAYVQVLGERAWIAHAVNDDGRPVAFVSMIQHGPRAWVRQVGTAPGLEGSHLYFGLVYHTVIRWAYRNGVRDLDYSISADQAKRKRGAVGRDLVALSVPLTPVHLEVRQGFQPVFA